MAKRWRWPDMDLAHVELSASFRCSQEGRKFTTAMRRMELWGESTSGALGILAEVTESLAEAHNVERLPDKLLQLTAL